MIKVNYLYVMRTEISGQEYFKIGVSNDPEKRLKAVQTGSVAKVTLETVDARDDGCYLTEKFMHRELSAYRTHGEWFTGVTLSTIRSAMFRHVIY